MNVIFGPAGEGSTDGFGAGRSEGAACARAGKEAAHQGAVARTAQAQGGHAGHSSAAGQSACAGPRHRNKHLLEFDDIKAGHAKKRGASVSSLMPSASSSVLISCLMCLLPVVCFAVSR